MRVSGKAYILGDDIDTDVIIPGVYLVIKDPSELARHALEPLDPEFYGKARAGVIIVAGRNFGMGSSREQAVIALKAAGVRAVVADSISRIFYRNAVNNGLPVAICPGARDAIRHWEHVELDLLMGRLLVPDRGLEIVCETPRGIALRILEAGGLLSLLRRELGRS